MAAVYDIRAALDAWPYDPRHNVRLVQLSGSRAVIQVRQPFGIEQYERAAELRDRIRTLT